MTNNEHPKTLRQTGPAMKDGDIAYIICVGVAGLSLWAGYVGGERSGKQAVALDAIQAGVAYYQANPTNGTVTFQWRTNIVHQ